MLDDLLERQCPDTGSPIAAIAVLDVISLDSFRSVMSNIDLTISNLLFPSSPLGLYKIFILFSIFDARILKFACDNVPEFRLFKFFSIKQGKPILLELRVSAGYTCS